MTPRKSLHHDESTGDILEPCNDHPNFPVEDSEQGEDRQIMDHNEEQDDPHSGVEDNGPEEDRNMDGTEEGHSAEVDSIREADEMNPMIWNSQTIKLHHSHHPSAHVITEDAMLHEANEPMELKRTIVS
jgi:hypothetical protein